VNLNVNKVQPKECNGSQRNEGYPYWPNYEKKRDEKGAGNVGDDEGSRMWMKIEKRREGKEREV
jgi:hypothetical protein